MIDSAMTAKTTQWEGLFNVEDGMLQYCPALMDVLFPCTKMWSDQLGHLKDFMCHIDIHPGSHLM